MDNSRVQQNGHANDKTSLDLWMKDEVLEVMHYQTECLESREENDFAAAPSIHNISPPISPQEVFQISPKSTVFAKSVSQNFVENAENIDPAEAEDVASTAQLCSSRMGTKRLRGKGGSKLNMCKNGLHCRVHDVLAPTVTILDNCLNALNIPHFASIQLMNYGDEIFELETKKHRRVGEDNQKSSNNNAQLRGNENEANILVEFSNEEF